MKKSATPGGGCSTWDLCGTCEDLVGNLFGTQLGTCENVFGFILGYSILHKKNYVRGNFWNAYEFMT